MNGSGLFFLTSKPGLVQLQMADGHLSDAWAFPLLERMRRGTQRVQAYWPKADPAAAAFMHAHAERLKRGQALTFELDRIRPADDGLQAHVLSCALAPDRWPSYAVEPRIDSPALPRPLGASPSTPHQGPAQ